MFQFKGCGVNIIPVALPPKCGVDNNYCDACLIARVEHLEGRLLSVLTSNYETPVLSHADIENNLRAVAKNWSRQ